ncbi:hypothetical protein OHA98_23300 [Streptomyces sp. NBC_00654]|uniref:hypothetical protein n=1 Tax=Streptomyces sp. NBC_00654 TaxID=2975799 RepID=UPI00225AB1F7|nr:hypothetical protein [Streptomyces sp. NBC_00654]MCX4967630.1 hypothetical protein [Streptomyces sp. NBC_00654]
MDRTSAGFVRVQGVQVRGIFDGPGVPGETGENTGSHGFADRVVRWSDDRGPSPPGSARNTWGHVPGPSLTSDDEGTSTPYGIGPRDHPRALDS